MIDCRRLRSVQEFIEQNNLLNKVAKWFSKIHDKFF